MITLNNNVELRNLQEQVLKNKQDIAKHYNQDRVIADFGIKVVGKVNNANELPNPETYTGEYGNTYAVGTEYPYDFYIWTRADINAGEPNDYWFNYGQLSIVGPTGPQGSPGPKGQAGKSPKIYTGTSPYAAEDGDLYINVSNGNLYQTINGNIVLVGNIMGPAGAQGKQGPQGPQGIQGPRGYAGAKGDPGSFIQIVGQLAYEDQLPSTISNMSHAYLIGEENELYIPIGQTIETAVWTNLGPLNVSTLITVDGDYVGEWNADTKVDRMDPENLDGTYVYAASTDGDNAILTSVAVEQNSIPVRTGNGNIFVAAPTADGHAANKLYVDSNFAPKSHKTGGSATRYAWVSTGPSTGSWVRVANGGKEIENGGIPTYVQSGQGTQTNLTLVLISGDPKQGYDVANKRYVDQKVREAAGSGDQYRYELRVYYYDEENDAEDYLTFVVDTIQALWALPQTYIGQVDVDYNRFVVQRYYMSTQEFYIYDTDSGQGYYTKDYWYQDSEY